MIYLIAGTIGGAVALGLTWLQPWIDDHADENRY
jgi:hypothetical protein